MAMVLFVLLLALALVGLCLPIWLMGRLAWLKDRGASTVYMPDSTTGRHALLAWLGTDGHRRLGDRATTRAVLTIRALLVAIPTLAVLMSAAERSGW